MNWKHTGKTVLVLSAVVVLISLIAPHNSVPNTSATPESSLRTIRLAGQELRVSVVRTPEESAKGLSGRTGLGTGEGMLFVFDTEAIYRFWMKDMLFSIDILWLSGTGEVVYIQENASPETYPAVFTPHAPARYVLELPAGFVKDYTVAIGDIVRL